MTNNGAGNAILTMSGGGTFDGRIQDGSKTTTLAVTGGILNLTGSLSNTSLFSFSSAFTSSFGSGVTTIIAVPEPGTIAAGLALLGLIAWCERHRMGALGSALRKLLAARRG